MRGYVLVGGASSRFGRDKADELVDGLPMAERVARAMEAAGLDVRFVGKRARWRPTVIEHGERHPLRGVLAALLDAASSGEDWAVVAPCDLPHVPADAFARLMAHGDAAVLGAERRHPLSGIFPVGWADRAARVLDTAGSVRSFAEPAATVVVPEAWLVNVNRPEQLR